MLPLSLPSSPPASLEAQRPPPSSSCCSPSAALPPPQFARALSLPLLLSPPRGARHRSPPPWAKPRVATRFWLERLQAQAGQLPPARSHDTR
eukprot:156213-Rhodomonas_salina.2